MKNEKLKAILTDLKNNTEVAERDLSGWDKRTLNGAIIGQRQARDTMAKLKLDYIREFRNVAGLVFCHGTRFRSTFLGSLTSSYLTFNTIAMYERLATVVEANLDRKREFNNHSLLMLIAEMVQLGKELDLEFIQEPKIFSVETLATRDAVVNKVRDCIRGSSGETLLTAYLEDAIIKKALTDKRAEDFIPVVVLCSDKGEAEALYHNMSGNSVLVDLDDDAVSDKKYLLYLRKQLEKSEVKKGEY